MLPQLLTIQIHESHIVPSAVIQLQPTAAMSGHVELTSQASLCKVRCWTFPACQPRWTGTGQWHRNQRCRYPGMMQCIHLLLNIQRESQTLEGMTWWTTCVLGNPCCKPAREGSCNWQAHSASPMVGRLPVLTATHMACSNQPHK